MASTTGSPATSASESGSSSAATSGSSSASTSATSGSPTPGAGASTDTVYVVNFDDGTVAPLKSGSTTPGKPIAVGAKPVGIAISPDRTKAYVTKEGDASLTTIDLASGAAEPNPVKIGGVPRGVAVSPDGSKVFVADRAGNRVAVVKGGKVETYFAVPNSPFGVSIADKGSNVFVTERGGDSVAIVRISDYRLLASFRTGRGPQAVVFGALNYAWTVNTDDGSISSIDGSAKPHSTIKIGPGAFAMAVTPDGKKAYVVSRASNSVFPVDLQTEKVGKAIPVANGPSSVVISSDGKIAYVASEERGTLTPITVSSDTAGQTIRIGNRPIAMAVS